MKKLNYFITAVLMSIACVSLNSCKKAADILSGDCNHLIEAYTDAANAYTLDPSVENCEAYVDALEDYVNGCAILTAQQKQEFQNDINNADCSP